MAVFSNSLLWLTLAAGIFIGTVVDAGAGEIGGQTKADVASANRENPHPENRDDFNEVRTIAITPLSTSDLIKQAAEAPAFNEYDFVFAGSKNGVGDQFTPIDPSDFFISQYSPWVVNNKLRDVVNRDAGGVNFLAFYTPKGTDPRMVNFVQAINLSDDGGTPHIAMDNGGADTPYYNQLGTSGTDGNIQTGTVPLVITDVSKTAWMLDIPYVCENGHQPPASAGRGCPDPTPQNDETIVSREVTFDTFIEADRKLQGSDHVYNVLYGGFRWGYTYSTDDYPPNGVPEPASLTLLGAGLALLGAMSHRRWHNRKNDKMA